jgi:general secretion pathway protein F
MPLYRYMALDPAGRTLKGLIEAESPTAARARLRKQRIFPVEMLPEVPSAASGARGALRSVSSPGRRIAPAEVVSLTSQLATLLRAGLPLVRALDALSEQGAGTRLATVVRQVRERVSEGSTLADALQPHGCFDALYVNLVRAGEATGSLDRSLAALAAMLAGRQRLRRKIQGALAYPLLMTAVGSVLLLVMLTYVLPQVVHIFDDVGAALPWPTRLLLAASAAVQAYWLVGLAALAAALAAASAALRRPELRLAADRLWLRVPLFGNLARMAATARVAAALGTLLRGGVPLLGALASAAGVADNKALERVLDEAAAAVRKGSDLAGPLGAEGLIPTVAVHMVRVGEESGSLEAMLFEVSAMFEDEVETSVAALTSVLEPLLILLMGMVIGFMVLAILMPIFQLNQVSLG